MLKQQERIFRRKNALVNLRVPRVQFSRGIPMSEMPIESVKSDASIATWMADEITEERHGHYQKIFDILDNSKEGRVSRETIKTLIPCIRLVHKVNASFIALDL